jgi:hypothetical protein
MRKDSVAPAAPGVSAATLVTQGNQYAYNVTVTGQVGATANIVITDGSTSITAEVANGMDIIGSSGSVIIPVDVSNLSDGTLTITVTLTNGAGDSSATTVTAAKDAAPPVLQLTTAPAINKSNVSSFPFTINGEAHASTSYSFNDGTTTLTSSWNLPGNGRWSVYPGLTSLKDGTITLTVTETDAEGNQAVSTINLLKITVAPSAPTVALNPLDDSGSSSNDYVTNVSAPRLNVTSATGTTTTVYVNGVVYTGQSLANGSYTVTAISTDAAGNVSTTATAPRTLVIDTAPPTGSFTISGATTINGQLAVKSQTLTLQLSLNGTGSSMWQMSFSIDGGATFSTPVAYAASASVTLPAANAVYTVVVRATDAAGNGATFSQTVRLDTAGPAITDTISAPTNNGSYDLGTNPTLTYGASDVDGVASISASLDSTTAITSGGTINLYSLAAGTHAIVISSSDGLGNTSTLTVSFQVHVTIAGLVNAVNYGVSRLLVSSTIQSSLLATLQSAQTALNGGLNTSAKSYLNSFVTQVQGAGTKIIASYASLLVGWTQDLVARL